MSTDIILTIIEKLRQETDRSRTSVMHRCTCLLVEHCVLPLGVAIIAEQETMSETQELGGPQLTATLVGILELVNMVDHNMMWHSDSASGLLGKLFSVLTEILSKPTFPSEWAAFSQSLIYTVQTTIKQTAQCLIQQIIFDKLLWMSYFRLSSSFIMSPLLVTITTYGLSSASDIRINMAQLMVNTWNQCPEQIQLVPSLVGPLLELILVPFRDIRQTIVPLLLDMMKVEQTVKGNFKQMETELIDKLDMLINENKEDEEYHEMFNSLMLDLTEHLEPADGDGPGSIFISSVSTLLERLLDYRDTLQGDNNRDKRMTCTANLLKFYKDDITRQELYIRYVYKLHNLHLQAHNFAEAGFTLLLHAGQLGWSTRMLHADLQFPTQQVTNITWQR